MTWEKTARKGVGGLENFSRRKKGVCPQIPLSLEPSEVSERGLPILPRVVGEQMGENQQFRYRQNRRERTRYSGRTALQL